MVSVKQMIELSEWVGVKRGGTRVFIGAVVKICCVGNLMWSKNVYKYTRHTRLFMFPIE
jgi:hypothetical protein